MRVWWSGMPGPMLRKDAWWMASVAAVVAYVMLQAAALGAAALLFFGRAGDRCLLGPECDLVRGWSDGWVGFVALVGGAFSVLVLGLLWKLLKALLNQQFWVGMALTFVGWATAILGLLMILGWGMPWLIVGAWLIVSARRMQSAWPEQPSSAAPESRADDVLDAEVVEK